MLFINFSSLYQILDIIRHKVILKLASRENSSEDDPEKIFFFSLILCFSSLCLMVDWWYEIYVCHEGKANTEITFFYKTPLFINILIFCNLLEVYVTSL